MKRVLRARQEMIDQGVADWAIGEALAFATLLTENIHVRISGQDVERGTFRLVNFKIIFLKFQKFAFVIKRISALTRLFLLDFYLSRHQYISRTTVRFVEMSVLDHALLRESFTLQMSFRAFRGRIELCGTLRVY